MPRKQPVHPALENVRRRSSRLSISMSSAEGLPPISTADTSAPIVDDEVVNKVKEEVSGLLDLIFFLSVSLCLSEVLQNRKRFKESSS